MILETRRSRNVTVDPAHQAIVMAASHVLTAPVTVQIDATIPTARDGRKIVDPVEMMEIALLTRFARVGPAMHAKMWRLAKVITAQGTMKLFATHLVSHAQQMVIVPVAWCVRRFFLSADARTNATIRLAPAMNKVHAVVLLVMTRVVRLRAQTSKKTAA